MRHLSLAFLLIILCSARSGAQTTSQSQSLQISAKIVGQNYCAGSGVVDFLHLRLRLSYRNSGTRKLILYRGSNLFFQVWVSQNPEQPSFKLAMTSSRYFTTGSEGVDAPSPGRDFTLLAPGAIYETDITVSLPVIRVTGTSVSGGVTVGEHLLRIGVSTWYESRPLGERLRERWRNKGQLWITPVTTEPLRFSVAESYSKAGC